MKAASRTKTHPRGSASAPRVVDLAAISADIYWQQDDAYRYTVVAGRGLEHSGFDADQLLGKALWETGAAPVQGGGSWAAHRTILEAHQPFSDFVFKLANSRGELRYLSVSGQAVFDASGRFGGYCGTAKDITRTVQMELRLAIEHAVTRHLEQSGSIEEASPRIIRAICENLGWACGARSQPEGPDNVLRCADTWGVPSAAIDAFLDATRRQRARSTQAGGLSRRVWAERKPTWILDVTREPGFRRASDALRAGLHSAFAFPIKLGAQVIGVMEFFSREMHQPDAELLDCMSYVGNQIGQFIQRTRAEEEQRRFRTAIDVSADLVLLVDPVTLRYVDANETACRVLGYSREELLGMAPYDLFSISREDLRALYDRLIAGDHSVTATEGWYRRKDGSRLMVESYRRAMPSVKGHVIVAVARDIGERKRAEQLRALEHAVTRCLSEAESASHALKSVIQTICESQGWECGRYFYADEKAGLLRFGEAWGIPDAAIGRYIEGSRSWTSPLDTGFKARVWRTGEPLWNSEMSRHGNLAKSELGSARDSFVFAVTSQGKALGVLSFTSREVRKPDERLLQAVQVIGSQIGQFLQRKQAEQVTREGEERFRALTELSSDFYWETDAEHRMVPTGYDVDHRPVIPSASRFGKTRWELPSTHPDAAGWAAHRAKMEAHLPFRDFEFARIGEDGVVRHLSISGAPVFDAAGGFKGYRGIGKDITARKRAEQLLLLEHSVTRSLAAADDSAAAVEAAIRAVCETEGWECGRYFRADAKAGLLRMEVAWGVPNEAVQRYIEGSRGMTYAPGVGIAGRVWQSGEPVWVPDLYQDARVAQGGLARQSGMHGAFVFPVVSEGKTIGVLAFNSREVRKPEERLRQAIGIVGSQIGQFVQRKQAEEVMRESEERFRGLTMLSSDMYWEQDEELRFTKFSGTGSPRVNQGSLPYIGKKRWEQNYVNMTAEDWEKHIELLQAHQPFRDMELCRLDEAGRKLWVSISGEPVFDASGRFKGYRGVGKDITARKVDEEYIHYLANHDALTALPNRFMFSEICTLSIHNARRYHRGFALMFVDLDRFKIINDTLGHEAGDNLLKEMAQRLSATVRSSDVVARLGGDEFVVLVQEVSDAKQVEVVARKVLAALMRPMLIEGHEYRVTGSIGISMYPADGEDEQSLMKNADIAMYGAKEEGKNTFKFYSAEANVHSFERLALESGLRQGLERNEFRLHYQAKVDLKSGKITGMEALVRWQHPDLGMVPPGQFIPLAEESGLIVPLGRWVLKTACAQNAAWQREGLPALCISVNLSARQFADGDLLHDIGAALEEGGLKPEFLELELTESMVMRNPERALATLEAVKRMGVRLAIDDFGVGYSSLTHLKRFPIDTLKVDRSFIRDIPQDTEDKAIAEAIIAMGKSLNLTVVAEGVETLEQHSFLREHGCDEMQGYYFSKPIPSERFAELLRRASEPGQPAQETPASGSKSSESSAKTR